MNSHSVFDRPKSGMEYSISSNSGCLYTYDLSGGNLMGVEFTGGLVHRIDALLFLPQDLSSTCLPLGNMGN